MITSSKLASIRRSLSLSPSKLADQLNTFAIEHMGPTSLRITLAEVQSWLDGGERIRGGNQQFLLKTFFGKKFIERRKRRELSQKELAEELGELLSIIREYEKLYKDFFVIPRTRENV